VRASRAALATLLVLGLAASAHTLGGGAPPGTLAGVVLALLVGPIAWWCTRRELGVLGLTGLLAGAQVLVHAGLSAMAPAAGTASAAHVHAALPAGLAGGPGTAAAQPSHGPGTTMLLWHVVATVVTALLLARAEDVLWRVVRLLLPPVAASRSLPATARAVVAPVVVLRSGRSLRPVGGRAPPLAPA